MVVQVGVTVCEPEGPTVPMLGEMVMEVALVEVHDSIELCPWLMISGSAVRTQVGSGGVVVTRTTLELSLVALPL
jgi:hypothetical protein